MTPARLGTGYRETPLWHDGVELPAAATDASVDCLKPLYPFRPAAARPVASSATPPDIWLGVG